MARTSAKIETLTEAEGAAAAPLVAFKGFDKDLKCRDHAFEVGKTYSVAGKIVACSNGFHSCENPFDVWSYYGPCDARFAVVEASGAISRHNEDSKIASAAITIKAELTLPQFISRAVDWIMNLTKDAADTPSGNYAQIGSSGYSAKIGSSGYSAKIGSSGDYAKIGSSGYSAQIGSSGYSAQIGSSGDSAQIGSSGNYAQIGSSGYYAKIGSSGNSAQIDASGGKAVIVSAGAATRVKAKAGAWISLAEFVSGECVGFATGRAGYDGVPTDAWIVARGGKLVAE